MDASSTFHLQKRTVAVFLLIAAALAVVLPLRGKSDELDVYMKAAERILRHEQIYRFEDKAFTYPPFFVLPNVPLTPLAQWARTSVWWFLNLCLLGAIIYAIAKIIWPTVSSGASGDCSFGFNRNPNTAPPGGGASSAKDLPRRWTLALLIAVLSARFVMSPLEYQSHDLIVFALVVCTALAMSREREAAAGICAGLAAACKATPLLFLPLFCWRRRFRAAGCLLAALIAATLLPDLFFRAPEGRFWVVHWYDKFISKVHVGAPPEAAGAWSKKNMINQGLSATVYRLSTPAESQNDNSLNVCIFPLNDAERQWLTLTLDLAIVVWLAWCTWPRRKNVPPLDPGLAAITQVGMVTCGMLLLSPMSSSQHFCTLLVPITACATYLLYVRRDRFVAAVLLLVFVFGTLAARDLLEWLGFDKNWPSAMGFKTWVAAGMLLACGRILQTGAAPAKATA